MKRTILTLAATASLLATMSCGENADTGNSTPIDSTNLHGTAPATYNNDNPAVDESSNTTEMNRDTVNNPGMSNSTPDLKDKKSAY